MKWKVKDPSNLINTERTVKRFAFFPKKICRRDGYIDKVWLEYYLSREVFQIWQDPTCGASGYEWMQVERFLIAK